MRIGTWNLEGRWTPAHRELIDSLECDVLLLTEVSERIRLPNYEVHLTSACMAPGRRWAGVASRTGLVPRRDPHPASALADIGDHTFCSSVLPWRSCGRGPLWGQGSHGERTGRCVEQLLGGLPRRRLIWGGDWNHALNGREYSGSEAGRRHILEAVAHLGLGLPTAFLAHRIDGLLSIDHIAPPLTGAVEDARRVVAVDGPRRLSDHDAYTVTWRSTEPPVAVVQQGPPPSFP